MPFADQRSAIARVLQDRRQGRMIRRQADLSWGACAQRLLEPYRQPVLVTPGNQRYARSRADRRIGISLCEAHTFGGNAVDIGGGEIPASIAGDIGITEVVGEDEQNVRVG